MSKTTKDNPAAFQKVPYKTVNIILKETVRRIINCQFRAAINYFMIEFLNYISQFKKNNQYYCNLCKLESSYFLHTSSHRHILYNSICRNCSSRKRHRGLFELYKSILKDINTHLRRISRIFHAYFVHINVG